MLSFGIVVFVGPIHSPFVSLEHRSDDRAVTSFLISGNEELLSNFTSNEQSHLVDVKHLINKGIIVTVILLALCISLLIKLNKVQRIAVVSAPFFSIYVLSGLTIVLIRKFESSFIVFHNIFFPQGNYTFPYDSLLIQTYPEIFFLSMTVIAGIFFILLSVAAIIIIKKNSRVK